MKIHMVAICGTGMGSLAGILKAAGHEVRGSDKAFYPPMSDALKRWGIPTVEGFDPAHIASDTDLVIVGNACRKDNPEAVEAEARGLKVMSFPQTLSELFIQGKRSIMVAGTHGKTTTASLIAYMLIEAGRDPSFLVGGVSLNFDKSFRLGTGEDFVVEGDEYDSAYFDKRPKFVHYRPEVVVLTSLEFDHADIYADMDAYRAAFEGLVDMIPETGLLIACADDAEVMRVAERARCPVLRYGLGPKADRCGRGLKAESDGMRFAFEGEDIWVPLSGRHNVSNALACMLVGEFLGLAPAGFEALLKNFKGVARRMQVRGEAGGVTVVDDFAHHPTEVAETVRAARERFVGRKLVAVFEPRTNTSRRAFFQDRYPESFEGADRVIIVPPFGVEQIPEAERFDSKSLVADLRGRGLDAMLMADADQVVAELTPELPAGAVILVMSNGAFGNIHQKLLDELSARDS